LAQGAIEILAPSEADLQNLALGVVPGQVPNRSLSTPGTAEKKLLSDATLATLAHMTCIYCETP